MTEPFFGMFQTPAGIGSRPFGIGTEGFGSPHIPQGPPSGVPTVTQAFTAATPSGSPYYGFGTGVVSVPSPGNAFGQTGPAFGVGPMAPGLPATSGGFSAFGAYEIPQGLTAPALLAAVAVRRGQPLGPTNDHEIEEFIYDAFDVMPGTNDVEVRCEGGHVTLTGMVQHKRLKHDVGEIAWAMPAINDVINNVSIAARRRSRGSGREAEPPTTPTGAGRKQT